MTPESIFNLLKERFPDAVAGAKLDGALPHAVVRADAWPAVAAFLRDDPRLGFDWLRCIAGVDCLEENELAAVYLLHATQRPADPAALWTARHDFAVMVRVPRDATHIPSVAHLWPAADWHERETYDLMGIVFDGHPDSVEDAAGVHPRRILCPDDWEGHPLRKDYEFPLEYHGIPAVTELEQTRPVH